MTNNKKIYFYIAANLALLIPVPGRFAYALVLLVLFNIQMATVTLFFHAIHHLELANLQNSVLALMIIALGIFYKQLLIIFCPIIAFTLGYCIFLPTLTSVVIEFFFLGYKKGLKNHITMNMKKSAFMSLFVLLYFLFRDLAGYGTLTIPGLKKIIVLHLPYNTQSTGLSVFFATIPGSLIIISLILAFYIFVAKKFKILSNSVFKLNGDVK